MLFDSRKHTMLSLLTIILWGTSAVSHEIFVLALAPILMDQHCDSSHPVH